MKLGAELHAKILSPSLGKSGGVLEVSFWSLIYYSHLLSRCSPADPSLATLHKGD